MSFGPDKAELRASRLAWRRALTPEVFRAHSRAIAERLRSLPVFQNTPAVLTYVSVLDNEVDTLGIIEALCAQGRNVLVPAMAPGRKLLWCRIEHLDELAPARFGLLEPPPERRRLLEPPEGALCLTPGAAFNAQGHRIGYGGGYYDRFLPTLKGVAAGLFFEGQRAEFAPELHDAPVDLVVTEAAVYSSPRDSRTV